MSFIFISYSRQDQAYVSTLVQALQSHRLPIWIDDRIDYGTDWPDVIEEHLEQSAVFLLVMSPRSKNSHWVNCELTRAIELNKPIFPLLLEGRRWLQVATKQSVDVIGGKLPEARFFDALRKYLPLPIETADALFVQEAAKDKLPQFAGATLLARHGKLATMNSTNFEDTLSSERWIYYTELEVSLKAGMWEAANRMTFENMKHVLGKEDGDWFSDFELKNFPCADLLMIDRLWIDNSEGRFGFSVQREIYVSINRELNHLADENIIFDNFSRALGWTRQNYDWCDDLIFEVSAPVGHLPCIQFGPEIKHLFARVDSCNSQ